jgi:hypothetical protein
MPGSQAASQLCHEAETRIAFAVEKRPKGATVAATMRVRGSDDDRTSC